MNKDPQVDAYVAAAPEEQQALLKEVRAMIRKALPGLTERLESGMPVYVREEEWISGFASRKKGAMFYCMRTKVLDEFAERLGAKRSGKSCVDVRGEEDLGMVKEILGKLGKGLG